jgi:hypothetical protein
MPEHGQGVYVVDLISASRAVRTIALSSGIVACKIVSIVGISPRYHDESMHNHHLPSSLSKKMSIMAHSTSRNLLLSVHTAILKNRATLPHHTHKLALLNRFNIGRQPASWK